METQTKPHRILIIDDSAEDRNTYRRLIARNREPEFQFCETDSGADGLRLYSTEQPDCVLLDYNLPDLNGLEFLARLDPNRSEDAPPIIMLTGQGTERVAVQALKMGAQDYLIKNRAAETVRYVVHSVIEKVALSRQIKEQRREQEQSALALRESEERYRLWGVRALRESEERYRLLVEGVLGYAIMMLDPGGHVILWNAAGEQLYGYRADEIIGQHFSSFFTADDLADGRPSHELHIAASEGHFVADCFRLRKDGTRFRAHVSVNPLRNEFGDLRGFAKVTHCAGETITTVTEKEPK
jgi:PAS domain S-box-containing protein